MPSQNIPVLMFAYDWWDTDGAAPDYFSAQLQTFTNDATFGTALWESAYAIFNTGAVVPVGGAITSLSLSWRNSTYTTTGKGATKRCNVMLKNPASNVYDKYLANDFAYGGDGTWQNEEAPADSFTHVVKGSGFTWVRWQPITSASITRDWIIHGYNSGDIPSLTVGWTEPGSSTGRIHVINC